MKSSTLNPRNLDEAFAFFEARTNLEKGIPPGHANRIYRLDRMRALCSAYGEPQDSLPSIHIAGSKGKGSTAAFVAALSHSCGLKTAVYASPHLVDYRERFQIQGEQFPEETALETARELMSRLPDIETALPGDGDATTFELLTLFAFMFFRNCHCDLMVLETGLGGRLDATNVVSEPHAIIITPIEKEHTEILGNRLSQIAEEKAGIFKKGVQIWSAPQKKPVRRVLRKLAGEAGGTICFLNKDLSGIQRVEEESVISGESDTLLYQWNLKWKNRSPENIAVSMGGPVQAWNAALALNVFQSLESESDKWQGFRSESLVDAGLPGRFQFLRDSPPVLIDGAHTSRSITALLEGFTAVIEATGVEPVLLFGSVLGKNHKAMAKLLCGGRKPIFRKVIISTPGFFKPSNPAAVADAFRKSGTRGKVDVNLIADPAEAWEAALQAAGDRGSILVTGSFFMAGEIARLVSAQA